MNTSDTRWLLRFSTRSEREEAERLIERAKFYRNLSMRMAVEIARYKSEIDNNLQTGESRLLGGAISIHAPYRKTDDIVDPWK